MSDKQTPIVVSPQQYKAEQIAQSKSEAAGLEMDKTEPGGRYLTPDGRTVDANGEEIKGGKSAAGTPDAEATKAADAKANADARAGTKG